MVWIFACVVLQGVNESIIINVFVVLAKAIPIVVAVFAIILTGAFSGEVFMDHFTEGIDGQTLFQQIKSTTFVTAWTFVGIEAAVVVSGRGKTTKISGQATIGAFLTLFTLYVIISVLSMGP